MTSQYTQYNINKVRSQYNGYHRYLYRYQNLQKKITVMIITWHKCRRQTNHAVFATMGAFNGEGHLAMTRLKHPKS